MFTPNVDSEPVAAAGEVRAVRHRPQLHAADRERRPRQAVRRQQGPVLRRLDLVRQLHGDEQRTRAVRQPESPQGGQLRDRPARADPAARRVRRQAHRADPRAGDPGYKPFNAFPLKGADIAKAKQIGGAAIASAPTINVIHTTSPASTNRAQVAEFNLKQVGFKTNDLPTPATNYYQVIQTRGTTYNFVTNGGWCADYFDPFDYLNVLFDGRKLQASHNNDYAYFNNASFNKGLDHAASLSGSARAAGVRAARPRPDGQVRARSCRTCCRRTTTSSRHGRRTGSTARTSARRT